MNRLVFNIVLLLGLTSCGMLKTYVSQEVQAEMQTVETDSTDLQKEIDKLVRATMAEFLNKEIAQNIAIERTVWSPPDSAGNQYIVEEETVKSETVIKEVKQSSAETVEETTEKTDSISVSASVEDLDMDTKTDIKEKDGLPWWQKTLMFIGAAVLIMVIIRIALKFL